MAWLLPDRAELRVRAVIEAEQTFSLTSIGPGRYESSLEHGLPARGRGLVQQKVLQFERSDLVELQLTPGLRSGQQVAAGDALATVRSPRNESRLAQLRAEREALASERALLAAGETAEQVEYAKARVLLAEAERKEGEPELERARSLLQQGAISQAELDAAVLQDEIRRVRVEVARAASRSAGASARPEALALVDARLGGIDARIAELEHILSADLVSAPFSGVLEVGGNQDVLRVYDLDPVYLRIPIPEQARNRLVVGAPVGFVPTADTRALQGTLVDLSEDASDVDGLMVFWASAELANPDGELRSGMTGQVRLPLDSGARQVFDDLFAFLGGSL